MFSYSSFLKRLESHSIDSWLVLKVFFSLILLLTIAPSLLPDEAQYWVWSQNLDIGYYSKPPGIAWLIALSTSLFGQVATAIRLPSLLLASVCGYYLDRGLRALGFAGPISRSTSRLFLFCPLALYGSFAATTDLGLLAGWCAACCYLAEPISCSRRRGLILASLFGCLFKPTILLLSLAQFLRPSQSVAKGSSRTKDALYLLLGAGLALSCPLIWNAEHDFVTLRHIAQQLTAKSASGVSMLDFGRPFSFLAFQLLLISPWVAFLGFKEVFACFRGTNLSSSKSQKALAEKWQKSWLTFHARIALLAFAWVFFASFWMKYQANWVVFAYPHLFFLVAAALQSRPARYVRRFCYTHCALQSLLFFLIVLLSFWQQNSFQSSTTLQLPWSWNAFRQASGWSELSPSFEPEELSSFDFLVSDKYQSVSELAFYLPETPVYWFNLHGARKCHYSFCPVPESYKGTRALFIAVESESPEALEATLPLYRQRLAPYFEKIGAHEIKPLVEVNGRIVRSRLSIELEGYRGSRPSDPEKY